MKPSEKTKIILERISEKLFGKEYILLTHKEMMKVVATLKKATEIYQARKAHNFI
jgi:hypothetical protein